jgi:hypothetical protein
VNGAGDPHADGLLDDFASSPATAEAWVVFTDRVMGGVSTAGARLEPVAGRRALRLQGRVSLERNGGFVQVARPLGRGATPLDARRFGGLALDVCGAPGPYFVHLRTSDTRAPWQHYRAPLAVTSAWRTVVVPWRAFEPSGLAAPLDPSRLTRLGLVGGRAAFDADLAVARVALVPEERE